MQSKVKNINITKGQSIGILSDAHGNWHAFEKAISIMRSLSVESFIFLGDSVGYIPSTKVIRSLIDLGDSIICIRGNHEEMMLSGEIIASKDEFYKLNQTMKSLKPKEKFFLEGWKDHLSIKINKSNFLAIHGSPNDYLNGYVYPDTDLSEVKVDFDYVLMGQTHRPFIREHNDTIYVNAGSCGLPRDDGRYGSFAILNQATGDVKIYRFDITQETKLSIANHDIHPNVLKLFDRRNNLIFGQKI